MEKKKVAQTKKNHFQKLKPYWKWLIGGFYAKIGSVEKGIHNGDKQISRNGRRLRVWLKNKIWL